MHICIDTEMFLSSGIENISKLLKTLTYHSRYSFFVEYGEIKDSDTFKGIDAHSKSVIEASFNRIVQGKNILTDITISNTAGSNNFKIEDAIIYLDQKVSIILENSYNDSKFIDAIINKYNNELLQTHFKNHWIEYSNAGGCGNIANVISEKIKSFQSQSGNGSKYLRCFVLIDSDKKSKLEAFKPDRIKLKAFLDGHNIKYHILEKREMENYLPDAIWNDLKDKAIDDKFKEFIDIYLHFTDEQKDYFDIEQSFNNKAFKNLHQNVQDLFNNISEDHKKILRKFKYSKFDCTPIINFKSDFPELFSSDLITKENLSNRIVHQDNPNELEDILKKIEGLL